jgi:hypothetical protein
VQVNDNRSLELRRRRGASRQQIVALIKSQSCRFGLEPARRHPMSKRRLSCSGSQANGALANSRADGAIIPRTATRFFQNPRSKGPIRSGSADRCRARLPRGDDHSRCSSTRWADNERYEFGALTRQQGTTRLRGHLVLRAPGMSRNSGESRNSIPLASPREHVSTITDLRQTAEGASTEAMGRRSMSA